VKPKFVLALLTLLFLNLLNLSLNAGAVLSAGAPVVFLEVPYLSQGNASIDPGRSCGPAAVAMALSYVTKKPVSIDTVRSLTQHPNGGSTYFADYSGVWPRYGLQMGKTARAIYTEDEFKAALRAGQPIVAALHMGSQWIAKGKDYAQAGTSPDQNTGLFDSWIQDNGAPYWGHMVVIIGYTPKENGQDYFIVNDPDDFNQPRYRYSNGQPKGKARRIPVPELLRAIDGMWPNVADNNRSFSLALGSIEATLPTVAPATATALPVPSATPTQAQLPTATTAPAIPDLTLNTEGSGFERVGDLVWHAPFSGVWTSDSGNALWWTANTQNGDTARGRWRPDLPQKGRYEVQVYLPDHPAFANSLKILRDTSAAQYLIVHNGQTERVTLDQSAAPSGWNSLGTFNFQAGKTDYLTLGNATGEAELGRFVLYGPLRLHYIGA
jgi:hypothetical protein